MEEITAISPGREDWWWKWREGRITRVMSVSKQMWCTSEATNFNWEHYLKKTAMGSWRRSRSVDGHGDGSLNAFWGVTDWAVLKQSWDGVWNIEYLLGIYTDGKEREEAGFSGRKIQTTMNAWQSLNQPQRELWCLYAATPPSLLKRLWIWASSGGVYSWALAHEVLCRSRLQNTLPDN